MVLVDQGTTIGQRDLVGQKHLVGQRALVSQRALVGQRVLVSQRALVGHRALFGQRALVGHRARVGQLRSRLGAIPSATARRGSSLRCDAATQTSLAASSSRRTRTGTRPASARRGSLGVLAGQPVMTRAAARISRSSSSTWVSEAAGSHAAAANSIAPRT